MKFQMGKETKDNRGQWRGTSPSTEFLRKTGSGHFLLVM